ncbi:hypothetical protein AAULR_11900, partial [Lacticaseibacillus rhamnosus MTCC 5462]
AIFPLGRAIVGKVTDSWQNSDGSDDENNQATDK